MKPLAQLSLATAVALGEGSVAAAELELTACSELDEGALREHLELELATLGLGRAEVSLQVYCDRDVARVQLWRGSARYPVDVRVSLRDTARRARERLVALAVSELVAQAERVPPPAAADGEPAPRAAARPIRAEVASPSGSVEMLAAASLARAGDPGATLWGGSLGTALRFSPRWAFAFETRFERGVLDLPELDVRWSSLSGFAGISFIVDHGPTRLRAGFGGRAGWLALEGSGARPPYLAQSFTAPWVGLAAPLRVGTELGWGLAPFIGAELGWVVVPVHGNVDSGAALMAQQGPWVSGSVGVSLSLR